MSTATEQEIDVFYGQPITDAQWAEARADAARGYDCDDLQTDAAENADALMQAMKERRFDDVGHILNRARLLTIDRRAEFVLTGRIGVAA
jgi:hypothetical protein